MEERNKMGYRISHLRDLRKETQADLAKALSVSRETVNQWENGTRDMKSQAIIAVAAHFDVTCDFLLRGIEAGNVSIHEKTGLSQEAIEILTEILGPGSEEWPLREHVNRFLSNPDLPFLFMNISKLFDHATHDHPLIPVHEAELWILNSSAKKYGNCTVLPPKQYREYLLYAAQDMFISLLRHQCDDLIAQNINNKTNSNGGGSFRIFPSSIGEMPNRDEDADAEYTEYSEYRKSLEE